MKPRREQELLHRLPALVAAGLGGRVKLATLPCHRMTLGPGVGKTEEGGILGGFCRISVENSEGLNEVRGH